MKSIFIFFCLFLFGSIHAQPDATIKALEKKFNDTTDIDAKLNLVADISEKAYMFYPDLLKKYIDKSIFLAEQSRDRNAMVKARRIASSVYLYYSRDKNKYQKANDFALEGLQLSKDEGISFKEKIYSLEAAALSHLYLGKKNEALGFNQEALEIANESNTDSLKIIAYLKYGDNQLYYDEKIKAFKNYLAAQELAEKSKDQQTKNQIYKVYGSLISFYSTIENYDKAADYLYKLLDHYRQEKNIDYQFQILDKIGTNYREAKKHVAAKGIYEEMGKLADSVKNSTMKTQSKIGILNTILESDEKYTGITYLKNNPDIVNLFIQSGFDYIIDYGLGNTYHELKMYDSASYYYNKAKLPIQTKASYLQQLDFNVKYGIHLYDIAQYPNAIQVLSFAKQQADSLKNNTYTIKAVTYLDSCFQKLGDFKRAFYFSSLRDQLQKQIDEKSKAKDVLFLEIENANKRAERLAKEEEEATIKRHNWQYMGIMIAIFTLFSLLIVFGVLSVPIRWVRALGFISFIFLFEFITLLADTWIHHVTHGEPWKVLGIKVILIAGLLPLHHWLEHKAIHFITTRKQLDIIKNLKKESSN